MKDRHLFRGKRIDNGIWEEGFYICDKFHSYIGTCVPHFDEYDNLCIEHNFEVDPKTIGQCTGKRDKNDKLIFEGDWYIGVDGEAYSVKDIHEFCCFEDSDNIEVVGHIHEDN